MANVGIHPPKTPVTTGSNTIAKATLPNVCKMPGPPAPFVPSPLPNIAKSGDSPKGFSTTVKIEGNAVAIRGASFMSTGDMASKGTGGGLISANTHGPAKFIAPGSMTVRIEGKSVHLLGDSMLNNCGPSGSPPNSATMMGADHASTGVNPIQTESHDEKCKRLHDEKDTICGAIPQLKKGAKVIENYDNVKMTSHITPDQIAARLKGFDKCLAARQIVTDQCFGGVTDKTHRDQEAKLKRGIENTKKLETRLRETVWPK